MQCAVGTDELEALMGPGLVGGLLPLLERERLFVLCEILVSLSDATRHLSCCVSRSSSAASLPALAAAAPRET